jgi:DNA-binding transcriptional LysR family regulator
VELDRVEAFVTIVRKGGFTRAAAALHPAQPAISRRVRLLEHEVDASLFERGRSGGAHFSRAPRGPSWRFSAPGPPPAHVACGPRGSLTPG